MINKIQSNNKITFKAWINVSGNSNILSKKDMKKIKEIAQKVGDERDLIDVYISKIERLRDNSWSEMRTRFTVTETVRDTYMRAIVNSEHFVKKLETINNKDYTIGAEIIEWLKTLPVYEK